MKRIIGAVAVAAIGGMLSGCGMVHHAHHGSKDGPPYSGDRAAHRAPEVKVVDGKLSVNPPMLLFFRTERDFDIVWRLADDSPYRFTERGIEVEGALTDRVIRLDRNKPAAGLEGVDRLQVLDRGQKEIVNCEPRDKGKAYACRNVNSKPGIYKYSISVTDGKSPPIVLDPPVVNW